MTTVVIGGGIAGATAALRLAQAGEDVTLLEAGEALGGLVVSFSIGGTPLECFYHHVFPHEHEIIGLVEELGLELSWLPSSVGILTDGRLWPFTGPVDLVRFGPLPLLQRLRAGIGAMRLGKEKDWRALDQVPALTWLAQATGDPAARVIWSPLLRAKFGSVYGDVPAAWMWGRITQRLGARKGTGEKLGYLRGGFRQLFDRLAEELAAAGVNVITETRAREVTFDGKRVTGVVSSAGTHEADAVLFTGAINGLTKLLPEPARDPRWDQQGLGVVVLVLEHTRPFSKIYWTNVCDERLPFGGIIEHTNLLPRADYGTCVTYLSRYFPPGEDIASADLEQVEEEWLEALAQQHPGFDRSAVTKVHRFRVPYAAPLVQLGHLQRIPPLRAHLDGLYVCTTAQIYPQDRGMSEGVRTGTEAAAAIIADRR